MKGNTMLDFVENNVGKILIIGFLGFLGFLGFMTILLYTSVQSTSNNSKLCELKGGYYFAPKYGSICLKKEVVIELHEE